MKDSDIVYWQDRVKRLEARLAEVEAREAYAQARVVGAHASLDLANARLAEAELALRRVSATIWGGSGQTIISEYFDKRATDSAPAAHQCNWVPASMFGQETCTGCHRYRPTGSTPTAMPGDTRLVELLAEWEAADSAVVAPDLMQHCCPSCGQPSGKGIDLFTYMAELVTKHPTAKGMLDLAMARAATTVTGVT